MTEDDNVIHVNFGAKQPTASSKEEEKADSKSKVTQDDEPISLETRRKLHFFRAAIELGGVLVTLDARDKEVTVPDEFKDNLRFNLSFHYGYNIPDFSFDAKGVRASLSFGGVDKWCDIPWRAAYAMKNMTTGVVEIFTESLPPELNVPE